MSYQDILTQYNNQLGMEARSVLKSMIINKSKAIKR